MKKKSQLNSFKDHGFSLVEVLVSISILAFISIAVATFTDGSITTAIKTTNEDIESLQIETAMSRLVWDISHLYSPLYFDHAMNPEKLTPKEGEIYNEIADFYQNNARFAFITFGGRPVPINQNPEKSELIIFTASNRRKVQDIKQSHFAWVKYELMPEREAEEESTGETSSNLNMLTRKVYAQNNYAPEQINWDEVKTQVLMHKIEKLKFEFWNTATKKWSENMSVIKNGSHLIRAIRLTLEYLDPSNVKMTSVRIFRPLFPFFEPENMYDYLKVKKKATDPDDPDAGVE